jgi:hypothetical protein
MSKSYRTKAEQSAGDSTKFFRWWQHKRKHQSVKTSENDSNDYTDIHYIFDADAPYMNSTNNTILSNHFFKKKLILGDIAARRGPIAQPITTVIVIASIFLFITMSITAATVVFCKKKNTVFVLNKSEQEDMGSDYELDELNDTDIDYADFGSEFSLSRKKSNSTTVTKVEEDPEETRRPLVSNFEDVMDDTRYLISDMPYRTRTLCENEQKGYRRLVVSAVVEKPGIMGNADSENEDSPYRIPNNLSKQKNKGFYRLTMMQSDAESDCENSPARKKRVTARRAAGEKCCNCAESTEVNWDNIKILPSRDGEELMLYESKAECDCEHKGQGQVIGHYQGQGHKRINSDKFESIPLDDYVGDSSGRGRYRKVPSLVESPFNTHSKGGAANRNDSHSPEVIVNRNFEDPGMSLPLKPVYDGEPSRITGVSPSNHGNQKVNFYRSLGKGSKESCRVHGVKPEIEDLVEDEIIGRKRYVLYEMPRQRSQGTNTGVTVSTQTGDPSDKCENRDANCKSPSGGVSVNIIQVAPPSDNNAYTSSQNNKSVNKAHTPPSGQTLSEIFIVPNMSSVQGFLPNDAEDSSVFLNEVSPPAGRFDNQQKIFHDISCHSDMCLSLMSPTDIGSPSPRDEVVQKSDIVSQNEPQVISSPPNQALEGDMSKTSSHVEESSRSGIQYSRSHDQTNKPEMSNSVTEQHLTNSASFPQNNPQIVPPKIPPRSFELLFKDSFASCQGNQKTTNGGGTNSCTSPIGQNTSQSPSSIVSPNQNLPISSPLSLLANRGPVVAVVTSPTNWNPLEYDASVSPVSSPQ